MGAAQHQGVQPPPVGVEELLEHIDILSGIHQAMLHNLHQPGRRDLIDAALRFIPAHKPGELLFPQGHGGGHHPDAAAGEPVRRQLQGRFDAHNDQVRVPFPQVADGCRRGSVAGHHQGLQPPGHQLFRHRQAQAFHLFPGAGAVGGVGGVAVVDEPLPGHKPPQVPQNADAAYTGIKYANKILCSVHASTPPFRFFSIIAKKREKCNHPPWAK